MKLAVLFFALAACGPTYAPQGPVVRDVTVSPPPPPAAPAEGPLSWRAPPPRPAWSDVQASRQRGEHVYLDAVALREDAARFEALVDELYAAPDTPEHAVGAEIVRREARTLARIAPYSLYSTIIAFQQMSERLPFCIQAPDLLSPCMEPPLPATAAPVAITTDAGGVTRVAIGELANPTDPAWAALAPDRLAGARAILLDLRAATGSDPRPLLPWLERVTGRAPLRPLREIRRHPALDGYVAAYAARFPVAQRDSAVWSALVGAMPARSAAAAPPPPIAVIVGPSCGAACELVARVLATYAGAVVFGNRGSRDPLAGDEPAVLELPHSKIEVFFFAAAYTLAADIEDATGPTAAWRQTDSAGDLVEFAAHELAARLANALPPRCDALPAYASADRAPTPVRAKLSLGAGTCTDTAKRTIVTSRAPYSALVRFLATCAPPIALNGGLGGMYFAPRETSDAVLSQIAQSDLVDRVTTECEPPLSVNGG